MKTLTLADVTKAPKTERIETKEGDTIHGMRKTLADSIAMDANGKPMPIPAGSIITESLSGGHDGRLMAMYDGRKIGSIRISYRA